MALYIFQDRLALDIKGLAFLLLLSLLLIRNGGFNIAAPALIAILVVKGFSTFTLNVKYDISYGLYIYAFPVQQLILTNFVKSLGFPGAMALALLLTCVLAFLSFVLVERPFLRLKRIDIRKS
ncbi:hypothetical protein FPZ43_10790 [Mucilaginibacter pallidiroseus]|uniref:Uncharacterized protein n=1 Tax=Mucilaginibacter pallidiroseus TaxID=2599295 RepID=A0A563UDR7_9SPHI|nr:hypothetical protein [Mucilaginibacter pallidiroseus]TWR29429.1 hypothetical protein FPZ43_10790 [Mucilaginibacter pallidiroseus]